MRVLLVEDDPMIGAAIQGALKDASYAADWVRNGQTALSTLACQHYDLVLLDLRLPGKDGLEVLAHIRATDNPVPLRAVLRRKGGIGAQVLSNGRVSLDPATREAVVAGGTPIQLANREFALLQALLVRPGAILSRGDLEDRIYGWGEEVESNAVEYLIHALRRKLGSDVIKNVRGSDGWSQKAAERVDPIPAVVLAVAGHPGGGARGRRVFVLVGVQTGPRTAGRRPAPGRSPARQQAKAIA